MKTHAKLSPSKSHRWLVCPGSLRFDEEGPESPWAADGTHRHAVLEKVLAGEPVLVGDKLDGREIKAIHIDQAIEVRDFIEQWRLAHPHFHVEREVPVEIGKYAWDLEPGVCSGWSDVGAYSPTELVVLDAKFGFVRVQPEENPQLKLYALGLLHELPFAIEQVTLIIAQPQYDDTMDFREHRTTRTELMAWADSISTAVYDAVTGSRRIDASDEKACHYCPARTFCPARMAIVEEATADGWMEMHKLEDLLPYAARLKAIATDLERRATAELLAGNPVRGYKLVASRSKRRWNDEEGLIKQIEEGILNANINDYAPRKLLSPAQMEKKFKKEGKAFAKAHAFQPQGAPKLAPERDERPALDTGKPFTKEEIAKLLTEGSEEE